jgi:hypothetical protein
MKPPQALNVPGTTEAERMSNALRMVLTVPKKDLLKAEAKLKAKNRRKREKARPHKAMQAPANANANESAFMINQGIPPPFRSDFHRTVVFITSHIGIAPGTPMHQGSKIECSLG